MELSAYGSDRSRPGRAAGKNCFRARAARANMFPARNSGHESYRAHRTNCAGRPKRFRRERPLEGIGGADLRPEKIHARVRIGLSAVGKMLVKNSGVEFQMIVYAIGDAGCGENVEGEVLALRAKDTRVAVEPAQADAAGNVGDETRPGFREVVA